MQKTPRSRLVGEVLSVTHSATSCRLTIELAGTPDVTAAVMKESLVEWGVIEGARLCADVDASSVKIGMCPERDCAKPG
jgi:molybdopterin-binding protein